MPRPKTRAFCNWYFSLYVPDEITGNCFHQFFCLDQDQELILYRYISFCCCCSFSSSCANLLKKSQRLRHFKPDLDESWQECSSSKYASHRNRIFDLTCNFRMAAVTVILTRSLSFLVDFWPTALKFYLEMNSFGRSTLVNKNGELLRIFLGPGLYSYFSLFRNLL